MENKWPNGWLFQLLVKRQGVDTDTQLYSQNHTYSFMEVILVNNQSMTSGAWMLTKLLFLGWISTYLVIHHLLESTILQLCARWEVLQVWWLYLEVEQTIKAHLMTLGVLGGIEMGDGTGSKPHTSPRLKSPLQDISTQLSSLVLLW